MSGPLVGLVRQHGPTDHYAWAVLTVIAEDLRGPQRSCALTYDELASSSRLSDKTVRRAVAGLVREGWVIRRAGSGRGVASTYRLRLERFPDDAVESLTGSLVVHERHHNDPVDNSEKGGPTDHLNGQKVVCQSQKVVPQTTPSVSVQDSVPPTPHPDDSIPGLLYDAGRVGRTDEQQHQQTPEPAADLLTSVLDGNGSNVIETAAAVVLADVPEASKPRDRQGLRAALAKGIARGWTAEQIRDLLIGQHHDYSRLGGGGVLTAIRIIVNTRPPARKAGRPAWCGNCDEHTRQLDDGDGVRRCPRCHPLTQQQPIWQEAATA